MTTSTARPAFARHHAMGLTSLTRTQQLIGLLLAFVVFYLAPLSSHGLWIPDETRYAQISQEMLLTGHWSAAHFMGLRYFEKPAMGYWMIAACQAIFGQNLFGVRVASAISLGMGAVLAWLISGRLWRNREVQLSCAVVYMSFMLIAAGAGYANLDPQFTLWVNLSFVALWYAFSATTTGARFSAWGTLGVACAMGFMTKGFLALLLPVLVAVPLMAWHRRLGEMVRFGSLAVLVTLLLALPWSLAVHFQEPDYWNYFFWQEHIRRFAGNNAQHAAGWYYYLPILAVASLPWLALLPGSLAQAWQARRQPDMAFIGLWLLLPLVFFSVAKGKLPSYIMPCLLPLALLIGHNLYGRLQAQRLGALRVNAWLNLSLGVVGLMALAAVQLKAPIYSHEPKALILMAGTLLAWTLINALAIRYPVRGWVLPALAMGVLVSVLPASLPHELVTRKTPDTFIAEHETQLASATTLLSNELGTASALAWHTGHPQVELYEVAGETDYGLRYPDAANRTVTRHGIAQWLATARQAGPVGMVLRLRDNTGNDAQIQALPNADERYQDGNLVILLYGQVP